MSTNSLYVKQYGEPFFHKITGDTCLTVISKTDYVFARVTKVTPAEVKSIKSMTSGFIKIKRSEFQEVYSFALNQIQEAEKQRTSGNSE